MCIFVKQLHSAFECLYLNSFLLVSITLYSGLIIFVHPQKKTLGEVKQILRETPLEENRKRELSSALHVYFKDWLYGNDLFFSLHVLYIYIEIVSDQSAFFIIFV